MIKQLGEKLIEMEKIKVSRPKVKDMWCDEQQEDLNRLLAMIDDLVECATCSMSSPMAYQNLQQTKEIFIAEFMKTATKYRLIDYEHQY